MEGNDVFLKFFLYVKKLENAFLSRGEFKDLSISEIHTISRVGVKYSKTVSDLAVAMGVTVSTMTTGINRLLKKGYINKVRSKTDRRIIFVNLTSVGEKAFLAHEQFHEEVVNEVIEKIDPQDVRSLSGA